MQRADLEITRTSPTCTRYRLVRADKRIWSNRVPPTPEGHQGARARMEAWAKAHGIEVVDDDDGGAFEEVEGEPTPLRAAPPPQRVLTKVKA